MKFIYILIPLVLFSCKQYEIDRNCFESGNKKEPQYKEFELDQPETIIKSNPKHVKFSVDANVKSFEEEQDEINSNFFDEKESKKRIDEYDLKFSELNKNFGDQFYYKNIQKENGLIYGIGENQFGYWLLEIKNNIPNAYYLGLSKFIYLNKNQPEIFVSGNSIILSGSFVRISGNWAYPESPSKEAVKDRLVFDIDLKEVLKDSDKDRFNDLFEKLILLNPDSADTDKDGISDFTDKNPLYKSEKSKFSDLYSKIVNDDYEQFHFSESHYFFTGYFSDCDYFQKINPESIKVLIYPEKEQSHLESDYRLEMFPDYIGNIKKTDDKERFLIDYGSGLGGGFIEAVFTSGKWTLKKTQTIVI